MQSELKVVVSDKGEGGVDDCNDHSRPARPGIERLSLRLYVLLDATYRHYIQPMSRKGMLHLPLEEVDMLDESALKCCG